MPEQIDNTIEVKEIATLEEINKNSLDYYYLEEENSQDDDDSSDEMSNEDIDSDEINIQTVKAKIEKIKIGKRKNEKINIEEIDKILSKFNIDNNNNNIKGNPFSENIEYHRFNEILKLYKGKYNIKKLGKNYDLFFGAKKKNRENS